MIHYFDDIVNSKFSSDDADIEIPVCLVSDRAIPPLLYGTEQHLLGFPCAIFGYSDVYNYKQYCV